MINRLRHDQAIISEWFHEKYMVPNTNECHLLTLGLNELFQIFFQGYYNWKKCYRGKDIGIVIGNELNFTSYWKNICKKSNQKLSALSRISKLTTLNQREKRLTLSLTLTFLTLLWHGCSPHRVVIKESIEYMKRLIRLIINDYELTFCYMRSTLNEKTIPNSVKTLY